MLSMQDLEKTWYKKRRATFSLTPFFRENDVALGAGTIILGSHQSETYAKDTVARLECLIGIATGQPLDKGRIVTLRNALRCWEAGDKALAQIRLSQAGPPWLKSEDDAWRLFLADALLDTGLSPDALVEKLACRSSAFAKEYDPNEARNPGGIGRESGRWTKVSIVAGDTTKPDSPRPVDGSKPALLPPPVGLLQPLVPPAIRWIVGLASRLAGPVAFFGSIVIPDRNPGIKNEGIVPGYPDISYRINYDDGSLRLINAKDPDPDHVTVALLGHDGLYREVETGLAIARALPGGVVVLDPETSLDEQPKDDRQSKAATDEPKLCPAPEPDRKGGRRQFDVAYEKYVRDTVNPQRIPQLDASLTFALPLDGGYVFYDDCQESTGKMIEAKGHYSQVFSKPFLKTIIGEKWVEQAEKQVEAARGRGVDWYFHEAEAADYAAKIFHEAKLSGIGPHFLPYPGGVPKINPRVR